MKTVTHILAAAAAFSSLSAAQGPTDPQPTTSLRQLMLLDSHPVSLEASVVSLDSKSTTYRVACPTAASPGNDACREENYYPADVVHAEGSIFAGTNTATASVTKIWFCRLGSGSGDTIPDQYGRCNMTTIGPGTTTVIAPETPVNNCFVLARSVPVIITAGMDKVYSVHPQYVEQTADASELNSIWSSVLSESSCPLFASATPTTTPSVSDVTSTTAGVAGNPSGPAQTSAPTQSSPPSGSSQLSRNMPLVAGFALFGLCLFA